MKTNEMSKALHDEELKQVNGGFENHNYGWCEGDTCPYCNKGILQQGFLPHILTCSNCKQDIEKDD